MTTYHVGMGDHIQDFVAVKSTYIREPFPAWTAIGVSELAFPGMIIEIRVIVRRTDCPATGRRDGRPVRRTGPDFSEIRPKDCEIRERSIMLLPSSSEFSYSFRFPSLAAGGESEGSACTRNRRNRGSHKKTTTGCCGTTS